MLALWSGACSGTDRSLQKHQDTLDSLASTTAAIADAWLAGSVSATFAGTAFEQTFQLVEEERSAVGGDPNMLADPRGARLTQTAEALARVLAVMMSDVRRSDASAMRRHLIENLPNESGLKSAHDGDGARR